MNKHKPLGLIALAMLSGCAPAGKPPAGKPPVQNTPAETKPTDTGGDDFKLDAVERVSNDDVAALALTRYGRQSFGDGRSLVLHGKGSDEPMIPLRRLGELAGHDVTYVEAQRRVYFGHLSSPRPITLTPLKEGGRSYLPASQVEQWLGCTVRVAKLDAENVMVSIWPKGYKPEADG